MTAVGGAAGTWGRAPGNGRDLVPAGMGTGTATGGSQADAGLISHRELPKKRASSVSILRWRVLLPIAVAISLLATVATILVAAQPWRHPPVLQPEGLTADVQNQWN
jgi:hypothetical protein